MTIIHFTKNISCTNGIKCTEDLTTKIMSIIPSGINGQNMHISIYHKQKNHLFWVTCYNKGTHENWRDGKSIHTKFNDIQKKFSGRLPSEKDLKKAIS